MFHWSILFPVPDWEGPFDWDEVEDDQNPSYNWLQARKHSHNDAKGFLLIKQLYPLNRLLLVQDLHTGELLINKRVRKYLKRDHLATLYPERSDISERLTDRIQMYGHPIPGDIRFARFAGGDQRDPRVEVHLPDKPFFQKLYAYGFPHGRYLDGNGILDYRMFEGPDEHEEAHEEILNASLYYEYLNGGSLEHAIMRSSRPTAYFVDEVFIWHLIEQLGRALLFLHFGITEPEEQEPAGWQPICHRWLTMDNIMLHWPDPDDDPREEELRDDRLPRVVLTNFDNAARKGQAEPHNNGIIHFGRLSLPLDQIKQARYGVSPRDRAWQMEEPDRWQDVYAMGKLLRRIVLDRGYEGEVVPHEGYSNWWTHRYDEHIRTQTVTHGRPYSDELIRTIRQFERNTPWVDEFGYAEDTPDMHKWRGNARFTEQEKPKRYFETADSWKELIRDAANCRSYRLRVGPAHREMLTASIAKVRPPDDRHYLMPFRTTKLREDAAEREMVDMMASLNGPAYKVCVEYGSERENARLAKTVREREVEARRAREERELEERVERMFHRRFYEHAGFDYMEGRMQEDERNDYRARLLERRNREYRDETARLIRKKVKRARKRKYGMREEIREEERGRDQGEDNQEEDDGFSVDHLDEEEDSEDGQGEGQGEGGGQNGGGDGGYVSGMYHGTIWSSGE